MLEEMARIQGVSAIVMDGLQVVIAQIGNEHFKHYENKSFWNHFILNWAYGVVVQGYEKRNVQQLSVINDIQQRWAQVGINMLLMKGQAMGIYYPNPLHRAPGDIDCYLFDHYFKGNEEAKSWADKVDDDWYKHSVIRYRGQTIENHHYFVHTREGKKSKLLNNILCDFLDNVTLESIPGTGVLLPPSMFNALFLTYHACSHFLGEGLRLKQLVDWAMFLKQDADKIDWHLFATLCRQFHLYRFAEVATDIAMNKLGVIIHNPMVFSNSIFTQKVIDSTLFDNDYVFSGSDGKWGNRWHVIKNMYRYSWKYHKIYQSSVLIQSFLALAGFMFKTE